jgi:hypothetical protein
MVIEKQLYEKQMQLIFRMLLKNKTNEQMASELKISIRSVQNYKKRLEQRYLTYQKEKSNSMIFLEVNLLKNRLLKLYRSLESKVGDPEISASDSAKCADVAAGIAINVIKLESEGVRFIKQLGVAESTAESAITAKKNALNNNLRNSDNDNDDESDNNIKNEYNPNRKF